MTIFTLAAISASASAVAAGAGIAYLLWIGARRLRQTSVLAPVSETAVILVEGTRILDATPSARDLLSSLGDGGWSWSRLESHLCEIFPDFSAAMPDIAERRHRTIAARDGTAALTLRADGRRLRLTLSEGEEDRIAFDRASFTALEDELAALRAIGDALPMPVWRQRDDGTVTWMNRAYFDLIRSRDPDAAAAWPPPALFDRDPPPPDEVRRMPLKDAESGATSWFDCQSVPVGDDVIVSAVSADALIEAETSLRERVQVMSRTFAHLTVGLAVFDRSRRLVTFNPAMTELTRLPIDLMLSRPSLETFLDALRARNLMPEPRNYAGWRDTVMNVERAAVEGTYEEMWHLPGERTFRVTGRPQADGAFALLIEDVSAEIGLTRQFRAQIETSQQVLDALEDAIAVFDRSGVLTTTNAAYDALWGSSTAEGLTHLSLQDAFEAWSAASEPCGTWSDARAFMSRDGERTAWAEIVTLRDGRRIEAHFRPLPGSASLVRFHLTEAADISTFPLTHIGFDAGSPDLKEA